MTHLTKKLGLANSVYWLALWGLLLLTAACRHTDSPPPDPCADAKPFEAKIDILAWIEGDSLVACTEFMSGNSITFRAPKGYDSYEWRISGSDQRWTKQQVTIGFFDVLGFFTVTFIGKRDKQPCFSQDDGIDTLHRTFTVKYQPPHPQDFVNLPPYLGDWKGYNTDEPSKLMDIQIRYFGSHNITGECRYLRLFGFIEECGQVAPIPTNCCNASLYASSYNLFSFEEEGALDLIGWGGLSPEDPNTLVIYYKQYQTGKAVRYRTFIAQRQ